MKSKSLSLPSKDDTVINTLKPEEDWHEAKVTGTGGKARDFIVVGLLLNQPLVINNTVLILKMWLAILS